MKKLGIIFAIEEEIEAFKEKIEIIKEYEIFDLKFYETKVKDTEIVFVQCGIGKVNAARCTQVLIDNMNVDYILNVGVAGGISNTLDICDIVLGERLVQHDFDITAFNHEKGFIPNVGKYIESDLYLLNIAQEVGIKYNVKRGVIASGDIFCTEVAMSEKINKKFDALCVEMEGASIAQVCFLSHIPFLVIRSISDVPNGNNEITYEEFAAISSKKACDYLLEIIKNI